MPNQGRSSRNGKESMSQTRHTTFCFHRKRRPDPSDLAVPPNDGNARTVYEYSFRCFCPGEYPCPRSPRGLRTCFKRSSPSSLLGVSPLSPFSRLFLIHNHLLFLLALSTILAFSTFLRSVPVLNTPPTPDRRRHVTASELASVKHPEPRPYFSRLFSINFPIKRPYPSLIFCRL